MMMSLTSLDLTRTQAIDLLTHPAIVAAQSEKNVLDGIIDASDRQEDGDVIVWWNDIEKDKRCVEFMSCSSECSFLTHV
jgi:UDP-glucose:glycoprotein glucosyltransferase